MKELMLSLLAGMIIGTVFKFLCLPLPDPSVLAGVIGVAGVYFGGVIVDWFYKTLA